MNLLPKSIFITIIAFITGISIGVRLTRKGVKLDSIGSMLKNLDFWIMLVSMLLLVTSIAWPYMNKDESISNIYLNVFSTMIFSWLLTRFSTRRDYREQELQLSKISVRHINNTKCSIEMLRASIDKFIKDEVDSIKLVADSEKSSFEKLKMVAEVLMHIENSIIANRNEYHDKFPTDFKETDKNEKRNDTKASPTADELKVLQDIDEESDTYC